MLHLIPTPKIPYLMFMHTCRTFNELSNFVSAGGSIGETPGANASVLTENASFTSSVISNEARQILNGDIGLSESMYAVMNGEDPDQALEKVNEDESSAVGGFLSIYILLGTKVEWFLV